MNVARFTLSVAVLLAILLAYTAITRYVDALEAYDGRGVLVQHDLPRPSSVYLPGPTAEQADAGAVEQADTTADGQHAGYVAP